MNNQTVLIIDFGGQNKELIARRVRECSVFSIVRANDITIEEIEEISPIGIIITGGTNSICKSDLQYFNKEILNMGIPVLGIGYGCYLVVSASGGSVEPYKASYTERTRINVNTKSRLFNKVDAEQRGLMNLSGKIAELPQGFKSVATADGCEFASIENVERNLYGVLFYPELTSMSDGTKIIKNFLFNICDAKGDYNINKLKNELIKNIREKVGNKHILLALSGGVDSTVCALLLSEAVPGQVHCVFIDHGLLRKTEADKIEEAFLNKKFDIIRVNAREQFLNALKGVFDPDEKRRIIGYNFIKIFQGEAQKLKNISFLAQGTIYSDVLETGARRIARFKNYHDESGFPKYLGFEGVIEPFRNLFKDEVRVIGRQLGLTKTVVERQPFPGPGLGIRIVGEITEEKIRILQEADAIFREEIKKHFVKADQYFAVLTDTYSSRFGCDGENCDYTIALRAIRTTDFMTCEYAPIAHRILNVIATRIIDEVNGVGRVVYDITGKPQSTIEWC